MVWQRLKEENPELEALTDCVTFRDAVGRIHPSRSTPVVDLESWLQILALLPGAACCHAGRQAEAMDTTERRRQPSAAWEAFAAAEAAELGGWRPGALCDGYSSDGRSLHWTTYTHPDGREVDVLDGGYCSDPELQALLRAQAAARRREEKLRPWHQRAGGRLQRALLRVAGAVLGAVVGHHRERHRDQRTGA